MLHSSNSWKMHRRKLSKVHDRAGAWRHDRQRRSQGRGGNSERDEREQFDRKVRDREMQIDNFKNSSRRGNPLFGQTSAPSRRHFGWASSSNQTLTCSISKLSLGCARMRNHIRGFSVPRRESCYREEFRHLLCLDCFQYCRSSPPDCSRRSCYTARIWNCGLGEYKGGIYRNG